MKTHLSKKVKIEAVFYRTAFGNEPVREWLKDLSKEDKKIIGSDIQTVQFGWPIGMPLVDSIGHSLWEVRSRLTGNRIARIFFFMDDNVMVLVNGFIKKTKKAPNDEVDLAKKRKNEYEHSK